MKYEYLIEFDRCKGCGLCIDVCPKKVLAISPEVNTKGYFPAYQARPEDCVYCSTCCIMCPDAAISIADAADSDPAGLKGKRGEGPLSGSEGVGGDEWARF